MIYTVFIRLLRFWRTPFNSTGTRIWLVNRLFTSNKLPHADLFWRFQLVCAHANLINMVYFFLINVFLLRLWTANYILRRQYAWNIARSTWFLPSYKRGLPTQGNGSLGFIWHQRSIKTAPAFRRPGAPSWVIAERWLK